MPYASWAEYWWDVVTGPSGLVAQVVEGLEQDRSVILRVPRDLPWRHEMRNVISTRLQGELEATNLVVDDVDVTEDLAANADAWSDVGRGLLDRYALRDARLDFRGGDVARYLRTKGVLANRVVWVKGLDARVLPAWESFCQAWHSRGLADGLFVVEVPFDVRPVTSERKTSGSVTMVDYAAHVNDYSAQLFCGTMLDADAPELSTVRKRYLAAVLTHVCHGDVETAALLIDRYQAGERNLRPALESVANELPLRGSAPAAGDPHSSASGHPLAAVRRGDWSSVRLRVWQAQLEVLFPRIEAERLRIVDTLARDLWHLIGRGLTQYDVEVTNPRDVELGTLVFLMAKRDGDGERLLYVHDSGMRDRIHLLRDCRNLLAHGDCCSPQQVDQLLEVPDDIYTS